MYRRVLWVGLFAMLLLSLPLSSSAVSAQGPSPQHSDPAWQAAFQIALAALLVAIVCLERGVSGHLAGLRANTVIAISSCLFAIQSIIGE